MSETRDHDIALLRRVTFFKDLDPGDVAALVDDACTVTLETGEVLFHRGDAGDRTYVVRSGSLEAVLDEGLPTERVITSFGPHDMVGEMALLTDEPRSATIRAAVPASLLSLSREAFHGVLARSPSAGIHVSAVLSRRLSETNTHLSAAHDVIAVLIAMGESEAVERLIPPLVESMGLQASRPAVLAVLPSHAETSPATPPAGVRVNPTPRALPGYDHALAIDPSLIEGIHGAGALSMFSEVRRRFGHVLVRMPRDAVRAHAALIAQADRVVLLASTPHEVEALNDVREEVMACGVTHLMVAIVGPHRSIPSSSPLSEVQPFRLPLHPEIGEGVHRLARVLIKRSVGLALSGGAAQGLAHVGVMKALIGAGIPIDLIAGTSGGALYGSLIAAGQDICVIEERLVSLTRRNLLDRLDPTLPRSGLLRGRRIHTMLRELLGDIEFADLCLPLYPVAADLETGEEIIIGRGPVHDAIRASISVPGVFEPFPLDGRLLVDGGVVNPMPVNVCRRMGADVVIAVQVPAPGKVTGGKRRLPRGDEATHHGLLSTVVRSYYFAGDALAGIAAADADILIKPDVGHFGWRDYRSAPYIIAAGFEAAGEQLDDIRARIALTSCTVR